MNTKSLIGNWLNGANTTVEAKAAFATAQERMKTCPAEEKATRQTAFAAAVTTLMNQWIANNPNHKDPTGQASVDLHTELCNLSTNW